APAGVVVHTGSTSTANSSYERDMQPTTSTWDSVLDVGQSFSDAANGMTITTVSADATGALVQVSLANGGAATCAKSAPTVALSPSAALFVQPGTLVSYTVTSTNNDTASCTAAPFTFTPALPTGWSAALSPATTSALSPGGTATTTMSVTIP